MLPSPSEFRLLFSKPTTDPSKCSFISLPGLSLGFTLEVAGYLDLQKMSLSFCLRGLSLVFDPVRKIAYPHQLSVSSHF